VELGRVQPADVHPDRAAAIEVGADIVALLGMRNGIRLNPSFFASTSALRAIVSYWS
jgi:hypothetical protein